MATEHAKSAGAGRQQAAEQIALENELLGSALGEIDEISRGSINDAKKLPPEGESRNLSPAERHADQARKVH